MRHFLFIGLLAFACRAYSQVENKVSPVAPLPNLTEVVIGIPNLKSEQLSAVKTSLSSLSGLYWAGYCEDQHYLFLRVNPNVLTSDKLITDKLLSVDNSFKIYYKTSNITQALTNCVDGAKALQK